MENDLTSTPTMVEEKATKKVGFRNDHSFCEDQMMLVDSNGNPLRTDILQGYASRVCSFGDSCQVAWKEGWSSCTYRLWKPSTPISVMDLENNYFFG